MGLTDSQRRVLSRKAVSNTVEVEDLIEVAVIGDATDVLFLQALKAEHKWPAVSLEGRSRVVPLGRWADTVCQFLENGYPGLIRIAKESAEASEFCIGVLEGIKTAESVRALLAIGDRILKRPETSIRLAARLADAFNLLLSFKGSPAIAAPVERTVREFLHRFLALQLDEGQRAQAVCALRGVGDDESLEVIASLPRFQGSWVGLEKAVTRHIKQRLRHR